MQNIRVSPSILLILNVVTYWFLALFLSAICTPIWRTPTRRIAPLGIKWGPPEITHTSRQYSSNGFKVALNGDFIKESHDDVRHTENSSMEKKFYAFFFFWKPFFFTRNCFFLLSVFIMRLSRILYCACCLNCPSFLYFDFLVFYLRVSFTQLLLYICG